MKTKKLEIFGKLMTALILFLSPALCWPTAAFAADVVVKGVALEGSVEGVTPEGVEFQTVYGKGKIVIPWADVDSLKSDKEFLILYSEAGEAIGRIWAIDGENLLVGETSSAAKPMQRFFEAPSLLCRFLAAFGMQTAAFGARQPLELVLEIENGALTVQPGGDAVDHCRIVYLRQEISLSVMFVAAEMKGVRKVIVP